MPYASPSLASALTVSSTLPRSWPTMTAVPPVGHDVGGGLASHAATAANDYQLLSGRTRAWRCTAESGSSAYPFLEPVPIRVHHHVARSFRCGGEFESSVGLAARRSNPRG